MENIEYEYNFEEFKNFLDDHKDVLYYEDYVQYINLAIEYKNKKVINYIIDNNLLKKELYNSFIPLLHDYELKECVTLLLEKNIDINTLDNKNSLLDNVIMNIINNPDYIDDKFLYLLYIIDKGGKCNVNNFCKKIEEGIITDDNLMYTIYIVDILLLYNLVNVTIDDNNEEINLLFSNINKNSNDIIDKLDDKLTQIFYKYYNIDNNNDLFIYINKLSIINKSGWSDDELFIYFDGKNNWCFSKEDVKYIKNTKMNPLNDTSIQDYIIDLM